MPMYTAESRQQVLDGVVSAFKKDERVTGVILVGSGVYGFKDEYSDIDMTVVVAGELEQVYADWKKSIYGLFPIVSHFEAVKGSGVYLYGFLLEGFLELDISFQRLKDLYARRPHWKVLDDTSGKIEDHMKEHVRKRKAVNKEKRLRYYLGEIWWYIVHAGFAIKRKHYVKAMFHIENVRDITITLKGISRGLKTSRDSRFRESDQLSQDFISKVSKAQTRSLEEAELVRALTAASELFFSEAMQLETHLGVQAIGDLEAKMLEFLKLL